MTFTGLHHVTGRRGARGRGRSWQTRAPAWRVRRASLRVRPRPARTAAAAAETPARARAGWPTEPRETPLAAATQRARIEPGINDAASARVREAGGPIDEASYACACGYVFRARVSTTVACPHCGTAQAW
jgi:hypothetical protein